MSKHTISHLKGTYSQAILAGTYRFPLELSMARLEKHPTLPIVMRTYDANLALGSGDLTMTLEDEAMIDAQLTPTYYLLDVRD